jgi:hypothetical protein
MEAPPKPARSPERAERAPKGPDDEALARLKLARQAAGNFAARLPSVDEWAAFLRAEVIPVYNAVVPHDRMCLECGKRMGEKKASTHVCSPECASRAEARRRPRGGGSGGGGSTAISSVKPQAPADTTKITLGDVAAIGRDKKRR